MAWEEYNVIGHVPLLEMGKQKPPLLLDGGSSAPGRWVEGSHGQNAQKWESEPALRIKLRPKLWGKDFTLERELK